MNNINDITIVRVDLLIELLRQLPADEGRQRWAYWDLLLDYATDVIALERERLVRPTSN